MMPSRDPQPVKTVLIEDNAKYADLMYQQLTDAPYFEYQVEVAYFLSQGKQKIAESEPELIVLDLTLPDAQGLAVLREIRQLAPKFKTALVVITGLKDEQLEKDAMMELADDFILKGREPIDVILRSIRRSVEGLRAIKRLPLGTAQEVRDLIEDGRNNPYTAPFDEEKKQP